MDRLVIPTPIGGIELRTEGGRLRELNLTGARATRGRPGDPIVAAIDRYFAGERDRFDDVPLDLSGCTAFERRVYEATRCIPYGRVASYGQIANAIGKPGAARAVGQALGKNPIAIVIPCHRVIASDGTLGGFSAGLDWKRKLLRHEGVLAALRPTATRDGSLDRSLRSDLPGPRGRRSRGRGLP